MTWLNLGCGSSVNTSPDCINVDRYPYPGVAVGDIDAHPWPWVDDSMDRIEAIQVFEHLVDPVGFMRDAWRVLRPGGVLYITVPHYQSENSFTDPTHLRHCTERTFDYWIAGTPLNDQFGPAYADGAVFATGIVERWNDDIRATLTK